jgi:hypothetical protein
MTNFKKKALVDKSAAEGTEFEVMVGDESHGTFKLRFVNRYIQSVEKELIHIRKAYARELKVAKLDNRQNLVVMLTDYALLDWKGIEAEDDDGNTYEVEFSHEDARAFFSDPDNFWIAEYLMLKATDPIEFQPIEEFDIAKN